MSPETSDGREAAGAELETVQRRNARRLGGLLVLVIATIVAYVFGSKLGWWPWGFPFVWTS